VALTIYGSARSRTMRVLWTAEEMGLAYEHVPLERSNPALKEPALLTINPFGTIPAIRDGDVCLSESLAVNLYLVRPMVRRSRPASLRPRRTVRPMSGAGR
jgi:glutathione S-transferase